MKQRILSVLLCMSMVVTLFTGCGSKGTSSDTSTNEAKQEENLEDIWENPIIEIDGTDIVLGESTLQNLIDDEWEVSGLNKFPIGGGSSFLMGSVKKTVLGNKLSFTIASFRDVNKDSDPSEIFIDRIEVDYKDFLTASAVKFSGLTLNSTKEEVYSTIGMPYVLYSDSYADEMNKDFWLYLDAESDVWLDISFDDENNYISSIRLVDYTNADSTISNTVDDTIATCEETFLAESNNYVMGEESFKARYPEWFGGELIAEETQAEETQAGENTSQETETLSIEPVKIEDFYEFTYFGCPVRLGETTMGEIQEYLLNDNILHKSSVYNTISNEVMLHNFEIEHDYTSYSGKILTDTTSCTAALIPYNLEERSDLVKHRDEEFNDDISSLSLVGVFYDDEILISYRMEYKEYDTDIRNSDIVFSNGITTGIVIKKSEIETLFPEFRFAGNDLSYSDNSIKIILDCDDYSEDEIIITIIDIDYNYSNRDNF